MRFTKNLETITYTKYFSTCICKINNTLHHWTKSCNCPATKIISKRKSSRQDNTIFSSKHPEILVFMPEHNHFLLQVICKRIIHIPVTIGAGKNNNAKFHIIVLFRKSKDKESYELLATSC